MCSLNPTEKKFEDHIEEYLKSVCYSPTDSSQYDRILCLIRNQVVDYIRTTQPVQWGKLTEVHDVDVENKVLSRISSEISKRGIIDVLRNQVVDCGVELDLCYFEPKSDLNPDHIRLYKSNNFAVIRQLRYSSQNENSIDMVLFLNGLPILTMELKNQLSGQNVKHSENQYRNDRNPKEPLLHFKRCMVHFCVDNNKVSMTTRLAGKKTIFLPYNRDLENPPVESGYRTKYLWEEILPGTSLLDIIENFVHVSKKKEYYYDDKTRRIASKVKEHLIFPRYHQLNLIRKFRSNLKNDGVGKNYLVQHATGSGKSYSIGWLSHTLASLYKSKGDKKRMFDTIIVVTDRTVLDDQLRNIILSLEKIEGVVKAVENGSKELKKYLEQGKDIVITTIQKFPYISENIASMKNRTFGVIIDEVHSSQTGELAKELKKALSKSDDDDFDYEEMLRKEILSRGHQDHISFFGFSGTPKEKTLELFGTKTKDRSFVPFHIYSMYQSIHEGFTLDVLKSYTTYKRYFKVIQTRYGDIEVPIDDAKREVVRYADSHEMTIRNKVSIILDHWIDIASKEIQGRSRGMMVTQSRKHCVWYFKEINRQLEQRGLPYRCLLGFSGEVKIDNEIYTESSCNLTVRHKGNVPLGLKNPKYRLLVVANKFQTGFDEPLVQTMYVDKRLEGIQCVQTLSRLNRTISGKSRTFVLDFVNETEVISRSFQRYYQSTILEGETDPNRLYDIQREIYDYHLFPYEDVKQFCKIFIDSQRNEGDLHPILDHAVDKFCLIDNEVKKETFRSKIQSYIRLYGYISQIIKFVDIKLEETFIYLKYLNSKLPKRQTDRFDISNKIDLDSLRIQKIHEHTIDVEPVDTILNPLELETTVVQETEYDYLSKIINQVNNTHGDKLSDDDRLDLSLVRKRLIEDSELEKFMNEKNTEDNKINFFKKTFEGIMIDNINERLDFYKKLDENPSMKSLIIQMMYKDYNLKRNNPNA